jgi:hypothetical protein
MNAIGPILQLTPWSDAEVQFSHCGHSSILHHILTIRVGLSNKADFHYKLKICYLSPPTEAQSCRK